MLTYPIIKIISGGQTGADLGAVEGARNAGVATGGTMPNGFRYENGTLPYELRKLYGFVEHASPKYPPRTRQNIEDSDGTLLFGELSDRGSKLTLALCGAVKRPILHIRSLETFREVPKVIQFIIKLNTRIPVQSRNGIILNVAGSRESKNPGIEEFVSAFITVTCHTYRATGKK